MKMALINKTIHQFINPSKRNNAYSISVIICASLITFACFLLFDPIPDVLLAISSAVNVGIFLWSFVKLYEMDLLLSPLAFGIVGIAQVIFYSWGNLGARIQGDARYLPTMGSLEYYPLAAFLSTFGLLLFIIIGFYLHKKFKPFKVINYFDLRWKNWQGWLSLLITLLFIFFLQFEFEGFWGEISRLLRYSYQYILSLVIIINTSIFVTDSRLINKILSLIIIFVILFLVLLDRSRTMILIFITIILLCWISLDKKRVNWGIVSFIVAMLIMYFFGTFLKFGAPTRGPENLIQNAKILSNVDYDSLISINQRSFNIDVGYRMAGFELPATILMNLDHGVPTMKGKSIISAFYQGLPSYFRPSGIYSTRKAIYDHFSYRGNLYDDEEMGIPLSIGLADFGIIGGPLIYILIAFCYWALWRISQLTPRFLLAFLMVTPLILYVDLFWDSFFVSFRAFIFSWVFLFIFGKSLMPNWLNGSSVNRG